MMKKFIAPLRHLFRRPEDTPTTEECDLVKRQRELMDVTAPECVGTVERQPGRSCLIVTAAASRSPDGTRVP